MAKRAPKTVDTTLAEPAVIAPLDAPEAAAAAPKESPAPTIGRTVLFVLPTTSKRAGEIRPAVVVRVNSVDPVYGSVNLNVQLDGPNDTGEAAWQGSVKQDQDGHAPGSWHWMPYQVGQAKKTEAVIAATNPDEIQALRRDLDETRGHVQRLGSQPGIKLF